jgi:uncharacterized beta-barrel protein YwiB (DUF1934 family)
VKECLLTIATTVDGQENKMVKQAEGEFSISQMQLTYREENALVALQLSDNRLEIVRTGDYTLRLSLSQGETLKGVLGFGNAEGDISVHTHKLAYSHSQNSFMLMAHYTLYFGCETQDTKIRLQVKF